MEKGRLAILLVDRLVKNGNTKDRAKKLVKENIDFLMRNYPDEKIRDLVDIIIRL